MYDQRLFGLQVRCARPIPFVRSQASSGDDRVTVEIGLPPPEVRDLDFQSWEPSSDAEHQRVARAGRFWRILHEDGTSIYLASDVIYLHWVEPLTFEDACTYLVGAPFALLLRMRGVTCLHASAVTANGVTAAFVGPSGSGKSMMAASLLERGAELLTDDLLALVIDDGLPVVLPSYSGVRLWPPAVEMLRNSADALPRITPTWDKRILESDAAEKPRRLDRIYLFGTTGGEGGEEATALIQLVANTYRPDLSTAEWRRHDFETLAATVTAIPSRWIEPRTMPALESVQHDA